MKHTPPEPWCKAHFWRDDDDDGGALVQQTHHQAPFRAHSTITLSIASLPIPAGDLDDDTARQLLDVALDAHARAADIIEAFNAKEGRR